MTAVGIDIIEFGFRSLKNERWGEAHLYTTDEYLLHQILCILVVFVSL
jgi:hypothetical protein